MEPDTAELMAQAKRDFDARNYKQAADLYEQVVEAEPGNALAWQELGRALSGSGKRDEAEAAAHRALQLDPNLALPYNTIGLGLLSRGKLDEAEAEFRKGLELDPGLAVLALNMADIPLQRGAFDQAIPLLQQVIEREPQNVLALINLGYAYIKTGRLDEAERALLQARALDPRNPYLPGNFVALYTLQRRLKETLPYSIAAFRASPSLMTAMTAMAAVIYCYPRPAWIASVVLIGLCLLFRSPVTQIIFILMMILGLLDAWVLWRHDRRSSAVILVSIVLVSVSMDVLVGVNCCR